MKTKSLRAPVGLCNYLSKGLLALVNENLNFHGYAPWPGEKIKGQYVGEGYVSNLVAYYAGPHGEERAKILAIVRQALAGIYTDPEELGFLAPGWEE